MNEKAIAAVRNYLTDTTHFTDAIFTISDLEIPEPELWEMLRLGFQQFQSTVLAGTLFNKSKKQEAMAEEREL